MTIERNPFIFDHDIINDLYTLLTIKNREFVGWIKCTQNWSIDNTIRSKKRIVVLLNNNKKFEIKLII